MPTKKITESDVIKNNVKPNKTTYKTESIKKKTSFLGNFIRMVSVLIILGLVIVTGFFAYIIINRDSDFSKWVVENTSLNKYLSLGENQDEEGEQGENSGIANDILGLNPQASDVNFSFSNSGQPLTVVEVVEQVIPSVLSISVSSQNRAFQSISSGTGFVVSEDGLVITNKHVIANECTDLGGNISVTAMGSDQSAYELELLTVDPIEDLAILKIKDEGIFEPVEFFDSSKLKLGTEVVAIGNVLGELQNTVTKGIVSGLNRSLSTTLTDECTGSTLTPESLIQTDAAINRGNSGGPLFESSGLLIGMNTFGAPDAQSIGLAIPSTRIKSALESFQKNNKIVRPRIGIFTRSIGPLERKENPWIPVDYGEIILSPNSNGAIEPGSAADEAGLKEGDIILSVDNLVIKSDSSNPSPLKNALLKYQKDETVELLIQRTTGIADGVFQYEKEPVNVQVKLGGVSVDLKNSNDIL